MRRDSLRMLGALAFAFYAIHAGYYVLIAHTPASALWACHVASLAIGAGCMLPSKARASLLVGIGLSWLAFGTPMWILGLATGDALIPTSIFTHVGSPIVGVIAIRRLGFSRGTWWRAAVLSMLLVALTRLTTPASANVNLAFHVYEGWEKYFPSFAAYFALLFVSAALLFFVLERAILVTTKRAR